MFNVCALRAINYPSQNTVTEGLMAKSARAFIARVRLISKMHVWRPPSSEYPNRIYFLVRVLRTAAAATVCERARGVQAELFFWLAPVRPTQCWRSGFRCWASILRERISYIIIIIIRYLCQRSSIERRRCWTQLDARRGRVDVCDLERRRRTTATEEASADRPARRTLFAVVPPVTFPALRARRRLLPFGVFRCRQDGITRWTDDSLPCLGAGFC